MNALLLVWLLAAAPAVRSAHTVAGVPVDIQITLRASTFWVGEPIRMEVRWKALRAASVAVEKDDLCFEVVRLLVRGPGGERVYREPPREMCEALYVRRPMKPGEEVRSRLVFFGIGGWVDGDIRSTRLERGVVFARPGEYHLRLVYLGDRTEVLSNEVEVSVEMPPPEEQPILEKVLADPWITWSTRQAGQSLEQYPTSRYLAWSRVSQFAGRAFSGERPWDRETDKRRRLDIAAEILAQDWGQFEEEALALAYRATKPAGHAGPAGEIAARLRAKFPGSWTVQRLGLDQPDD